MYPDTRVLKYLFLFVIFSIFFSPTRRPQPTVSSNNIIHVELSTKFSTTVVHVNLVSLGCARSSGVRAASGKVPPPCTARNRSTLVQTEILEVWGILTRLFTRTCPKFNFQQVPYLKVCILYYMY